MVFTRCWRHSYLKKTISYNLTKLLLFYYNFSIDKCNLPTWCPTPGPTIHFWCATWTPTHYTPPESVLLSNKPPSWDPCSRSISLQPSTLRLILGHLPLALRSIRCRIPFGSHGSQCPKRYFLSRTVRLPLCNRMVHALTDHRPTPNTSCASRTCTLSNMDILSSFGQVKD
jgi:hypothetical protein